MGASFDKGFCSAKILYFLPAVCTAQEKHPEKIIIKFALSNKNE